MLCRHRGPVQRRAGDEALRANPHDDAGFWQPAPLLAQPGRRRQDLQSGLRRGPHAVIRKALIALLALLGVLGLVLAVNTLRQGSLQVIVSPLPPLAVDGAAAAASLAAAVRARTVTGMLDTPAPCRDLRRAAGASASSATRVCMASLQREVVGGHSLLYTWAGSDPAAPAIVLMAHQDVVPVAPGTEALWQQPPFSGAIKDGFVWGRGAWDDKGNLIARARGASSVLAGDGFQPRRTVYLVVGARRGDRWSGGRQGDRRGCCKQRGVKLEFVIDEGLLIADGMLPGLKPPAALVGIAEKGFVSVAAVGARARPGHSSMPPPPASRPSPCSPAALAQAGCTADARRHALASRSRCSAVVGARDERLQPRGAGQPVADRPAGRAHAVQGRRARTRCCARPRR